MRRALVVGAGLLGAGSVLSGCMVGPDYQRPPAIVSAHYKELAGWAPGKPADTIDRGAWWSIYHDPVLNGLEQEVAAANQTLQAQEAAYRLSIATIAQARSQLFPTIAVTSSVQRSISGSRGGATTLVSPGGTSLGGSSLGSSSTGTSTVTSTSTSTGVSGAVSSARTSFSVEGSVDWELDLWGRVRRQIEGDVAAAQASAADVANAKLSAQGQLAIDYFEMRAADSLAALLDETVRDYREAVRIAQNQYTVGVAAQGDVITAQTQLQSAIAASINVGVQRSQLEHAIAVLTGRAPGDVTLPPMRLATEIPVVPPGIPSALLERRPDIAAAERTMQAQNAQIGAAVAAFYPQVTLSALFGYAGNPIQSLVQAANRVWSLGASASETLFDGGSRSATVAAARANYDQAVATYRQTVLTAFEAVEDQLSSLRILAQQADAEEKDVALARRAVQIALNEYRAGTQPYTTVITAQNTLLGAEQTALTVQQQRFVASVSLIEALGGGWTAADLSSVDGGNLPRRPAD